MKILLDECVVRRFRRDLPGHEVQTVQQMGWAGIKNGALLRLAEAHFDVFLTVDRNLMHQQRVHDFQLAIIVVAAGDSRYPALRPYASAVLVALETAQNGQVVEITTPEMP